MQVPVVAVVPTFRPDARALAELCSVLSGSGATVVVSDDASPCTSDLALRMISTLPHVTVIRHQHNRGVARGLNDGLALARAAGAAWLLTVDQDSSLSTDYLSGMLDVATNVAASIPSVRIGAWGAQTVMDRSGPIAYPTHRSQGLLVTEEVIQSGTMWSVDAIAAVGGFDETLGIDGVDAAACLALRRHGLAIALAEGLQLSHSLGSARSVSILGRRVLATGHTPTRRATIVRNRLRLLPQEFVENPVHALRTLRRLTTNSALAVAIEEDRLAQAVAVARGVLGRAPR